MFGSFYFKGGEIFGTIELGFNTLWASKNNLRL